MGEVWKAHDQETREAVAVKLSPQRDAEEAARFERETQILAGMAHPHVVRYVAHGACADGMPYLGGDRGERGGRRGDGVRRADDPGPLARR
ncbi:protein kinase [Sorangium sp. So ce341]|uniref:protein kinase n=1 Tax=Sorangium sp. So ce341 TaxID=3133302 RepID=UPI003F635DA2